MAQFDLRLRQQLQRLKEQGLQRQILPVQTTAISRIQVAGREYLNLAGNDYLGLGSNRELALDFFSSLEADNCLEQYGLGSGASRLMTGNHDQYRQLEESLAALYGVDKALVFNSGYHCNIGLLPALARKGDLVLADKLCHASMIDGMRLCRAKVIRYPHLDYNRVEDLLKKNQQNKNNKKQTVFIVTESIFSMDGDCADLATLVRLKEQYGAVLYVDEAHGVGIRGQSGLGLIEEQGVTKQVDLLVGTFGKAWAGQGAFVACSGTVYDFLVNTARSLIFTTGLPPINIHWLNFILPKIKKMTEERQQLHDLGNTLRKAIQEKGLDTDGDSQIVPVMIGDSARAVAVADQLRQHGFWISAVRPPTVPHGTSRLRLTLTADMDFQQLASLPGLIAQALR